MSCAATPASLGRPQPSAADGHDLRRAPILTAIWSTSRSRASPRTSRRGPADAVATTPAADACACAPSATQRRRARLPDRLRGKRRPRRHLHRVRHRERAQGQPGADRLRAAELRLVRVVRPLSICGMFIDVRLFAMLRERAGSESVTVEVPDGATVRDARRRGRARARARGRDRAHAVVMAVNREYADARRTPGGGRRARV